jgi:hypothetical protein
MIDSGDSAITSPSGMSRLSAETKLVTTPER